MCFSLNVKDIRNSYEIVHIFINMKQEFTEK